jgi:hypothetical protein
MNTSYKKAGQDAEAAMSGAADNLSDMARENGRTVKRAVEDATTTAKRKAEDMGDTMGDAARDFGAGVKDAAGDAMDDAKSRLGAVRDAVASKASEAKDAVVSGAGSTMSAVRDAAVEKADGARESLSEVGDRLAATLNRAADDDNSDGLKTRVLGSVAQGLTQASEALRQRSVADITSDVKEMAKRHPGAFMAAAALVGFAAARFVRSSAQRRHDSDPRA